MIQNVLHQYKLLHQLFISTAAMSRWILTIAILSHRWIQVIYICMKALQHAQAALLTEPMDWMAS